jgi:hypothetical protein
MLNLGRAPSPVTVIEDPNRAAMELASILLP